MTYRDRREARADRLRNWADKNEANSTQRLETAHNMANMIPFGQPILVGHHSEQRDRNYRDRITSNMGKGVELGRKADAQRSRADNIEAAAAHAIYSDDPDAIERLEEKIAGLETERARIKAYNASCRKRKAAGDTSLLDDAQRADLVTIARVCSYQLGEYGQFPTYAASNISGNISRLRKRLEQLSRNVAPVELTADELGALSNLTSDELDHIAGGA